MSDRAHGDPSKLLGALKERAKELDCLYRVEECLGDAERPLAEILQAVTSIVPSGMQYPEIAQALITYSEATYRSRDFELTPWRICADIKIQDQILGSFCIYYTELRRDADEGPFLKEEVRLLSTVADRLGHFILYQRMKSVRNRWGKSRRADRLGAWRGSLQLLRTSDRRLYLKIARKMLSHLYSLGIEDARSILQKADVLQEADEVSGELNVPGQRHQADESVLLTDRPFEVAAEHLSGESIMALVQKWLQEDKAAFFIKILSSPGSSLYDISSALRRFHYLSAGASGISSEVLSGLRVSLTRRFLTEQLEFIKIAKDFFSVEDFVTLTQRIVMPADSHGTLGGKSAGLVLSYNILMRRPDPQRPVGEIKVPKTWHIASDGILEFMSHNDLEDLVEQKYKEISQIRLEYPYIVQLFKASDFPPDLIQGLSAALDELGEGHLVIRSSSLLEDRLGTAFSGKYKSLFLANQGDKQTRLSALLDAVAEVYASVFGPDPIEYRREHGLLEFNEEMGILIQEVVGVRVGRYFLPAFAGVAFCNNEFRWSPRIRREDGIVRLVPGLGTRAVDRVSDDYPVLLVPGQPKLRANVSPDQIIRYSPRKLDVINLETNTLETKEIRLLLQEIGAEYPAFERIFAVLKNDMFSKPVGLLIDPARDELVPTFDDLFASTPFVSQLKNILSILKEQMGTPVDVEFAHDGKDFYLLQCRPQSFSREDTPAPIPMDVPDEDVIFSAKRFVSNGWIPDITHIVYVDPDAYGELAQRKDLLAVGRAVGRINELLPKRQFILMGPGRWGSKGDIKLGVSVTYADISNTAMLVEIAWRKGGYLPDLSFGTHFFQDLVESRIRYLPLYPDDDGIRFNTEFLSKAANLLPELLPDFAFLSDVIRVIEVPAVSQGRVLRVLMNAELDEALGYLVSPAEPLQEPVEAEGTGQVLAATYWRWRLQMSEQIAQRLDAGRFGVVALYVFGSTKNGTAGPGSDIDLLVHFRGSDEQQRDLLNWLEGWSFALDEVNFLRTGYRCDGLLDVHIVTDEDIAQRSSFAVKIGALTDAARELPIGKPA